MAFLTIPFCVRTVLLLWQRVRVVSEMSSGGDRFDHRSNLDAEQRSSTIAALRKRVVVSREREGEGHPVVLSEWLAVAEDVVVAWR